MRPPLWYGEDTVKPLSAFARFEVARLLSSWRFRP